MQFLENLFGPTSRNLGRAMDQASRRHGLLSENLANVNTPGYKRRDLDFGTALEDALSRPAGIGGAGQPSRDASSIRQDGSSVDLEREVMAMAETELRYQMLTDMTANYFRDIKNVIKEGR